ncbi:MAG TPA: D-alanine--D-alanine ligase [Candidatus Saccharimonadales bacterium]|nr:D-alanine--D-alanine ligase [Candidatus Saccharimonadales bacterium]
MASVIVLAGGSSDEREISLRSGAAVAEALKLKGHEVQELDPSQPIPPDTLKQADVVFPVLHGAGGEDGSLQGQLDALQVAYVGSGVAASELCFDKWRYKQFINSHGLPVPHGEIVTVDTFWQFSLVSKPFVFKPYDGGSSVDTYLHRSGLVPKETIADIFTRHPKMLLEELVEGTEITVSVLGDQALPVIEIIPPSGGEFDYTNKYNGKSQELCPPEHVSAELQQKAQELALKAHNLCGCRDYSRTDIMINSAGELYILETNTIPGMTTQSLFPKAAETTGISMEDLCDRLVQMALARKTT